MVGALVTLETARGHDTLFDGHARLPGPRVARRTFERFFRLVLGVCESQIARVRRGATPVDTPLLRAVVTTLAQRAGRVELGAIAFGNALVTTRAKWEQPGVLLVREVVVLGALESDQRARRAEQ
jgi:hypothetical protein